MAKLPDFSIGGVNCRRGPIASPEGEEHYNTVNIVHYKLKFQNYYLFMNSDFNCHILVRLLKTATCFNTPRNRAASAGPMSL